MERVLSTHIKGRYRLVGIQPGEMIIKGVKYDFRTISKADADALFASGCRFLAPASKEAEKQILEEVKVQAKEGVSKEGARRSGKPVINGDELLKVSEKKKAKKAGKNKSGVAESK